MDLEAPQDAVLTQKDQANTVFLLHGYGLVGKTLFLFPERILPSFLLFTGFTKKWRERSEIQQPLIHPMKWRIERPRKIHEQHHPITFGVIPHFVVEGVVKDQGLALAPGIEIVADAYAHAFARLGDHQAQM